MKKELIKKFNLIKTNEKVSFRDGTKLVERIKYKNDCGVEYVFYQNDLHVLIQYPNGKYDLGAGYKWYH